MLDSRSPVQWQLRSIVVSLIALPIVLLYAIPANSQHHMEREPHRDISQRGETRPLKVTNLCAETIYPGVGTQAGKSPESSGFKLESGKSRDLTVGADWQGRVWGRTNCSFNYDGTGPSNNGGYNGGGSACTTGDCGGTIACLGAVCILYLQQDLPFGKSLNQIPGQPTCDPRRIHPRSLQRSNILRHFPRGRL